MADVIELKGFRVDPSVKESIYSAEIFGATVRFFRGKETVDLPWCPIADIAAVAKLSPEQLDALRWSIADKWFDILRVVKTSEANEIVLPLLGASSLLQQFEDMADGTIEAGSTAEFYEAASVATRMLIGQIGPETPGGAFQLMLLAARNALAPSGLDLELRPVASEQGRIA